MKDDYTEYRDLCVELKRKVADGEISNSMPLGFDTCVVLGKDSNDNQIEWDLNYYGKKEGYILAYYNKYSNNDSPAGEADFKNPNELDRAIKEILGENVE